MPTHAHLRQLLDLFIGCKPESDRFIGWKHDSKTQLNLKGMKIIVFLLGSFSHHFRFDGDCVVPFPYKIEAYQNQP
jgi:hypothetical protein